MKNEYQYNKAFDEWNAAKAKHEDPNFLCILINPVTRELIEIRRKSYLSDTVVRAKVGLRAYPGSISYDEAEVYEVGDKEYLRSHSISANIPDEDRGKGYGFILYAGLCLRAYSDTDAYGIGSTDGDGNRSTRTASATEFWERAVKIGVASLEAVSGEGQAEYEVSKDYLYDCDFVPDSECIEVNDVSGDITIEYTSEDGTAEAEIMDAENNVVKTPVVFSLAGLKGGNDLDYDYPSPETLASLNLNNFYDLELFNLIIELLLIEDFKFSYLYRLARTLPPEIYVATEFAKQLDLDFTPNMAEVQKEVDSYWKDTFGDLVDLY